MTTQNTKPKLWFLLQGVGGLLCLFFASPAFAQSYKLYNTATEKVVTVADVVKDMGKADVLFFGEDHQDSVGHTAELALWAELSRQYPNRAALSMEMFETDCQLVLDEYLQGLIREKNMVAEARAWPNYNHYRPLIELAKVQHLPVMAANAPARYVNMVNRMGLQSLQQLSATAKGYLAPLPIDTATGAYYQKFAEIMGGHASMPGMQLYQAQNLWDATMGWSIARFLQAHPDYKILQLNGGFHSEDKLGTAAQLKKYAPTARIINIAASTVDAPTFAHPNWSKYGKQNNYILLTEGRFF